MFVWALNTPLNVIWLTYQKACISTKKIVAGLAHKKYFKKQPIVKKKIKKIIKGNDNDNDDENNAQNKDDKRMIILNSNDYINYN